jgi:hypothetical protein
MVISGFAQRLWLADDDRALHAGTWRLINQAMDRSPLVAVDVFKTKAHRSVEQVLPEELKDFLGNEAVDLLAKQAATDRTSIELMKLVEAELSGQLAKARRVVQWLADQVWPDSKASGKAPGPQVRRSAQLPRRMYGHGVFTGGDVDCAAWRARVAAPPGCVLGPCSVQRCTLAIWTEKAGLAVINALLFLFVCAVVVLTLKGMGFVVRAKRDRRHLDVCQL